jgi:hypothetical protein
MGGIGVGDRTDVDTGPYHRRRGGGSRLFGEEACRGHTHRPQCPIAHPTVHRGNPTNAFRGLVADDMSPTAE